MSNDNDYPKYDSDDEFRGYGVRLAKDAETIKTKNGEMTKITFVATSQGDEDEDVWFEGIVNDGQAEKAAGLQKGDVLMSVVGKMAVKRSKEDPTKLFFNLKRVRLHFGIALLVELKARDGGGKKPAGKATGTKGAKPAAKTAAKPAGKKAARPIIEDDEDEDSDEE